MTRGIRERARANDGRKGLAADAICPPGSIVEDGFAFCNNTAYADSLVGGCGQRNPRTNVMLDEADFGAQNLL